MKREDAEKVPQRPTDSQMEPTAGCVFGIRVALLLAGSSEPELWALALFVLVLLEIYRSEGKGFVTTSPGASQAPASRSETGGGAGGGVLRPLCSRSVSV